MKVTKTSKDDYSWIWTRYNLTQKLAHEIRIVQAFINSTLAILIVLFSPPPLLGEASMFILPGKLYIFLYLFTSKMLVLCTPNHQLFFFLALKNSHPHVFLHPRFMFLIPNCYQWIWIVFRLELLEDFRLKGLPSHILVVPFPPKLPLESISP